MIFGDFSQYGVRPTLSRITRDLLVGLGLAPVALKAYGVAQRANPYLALKNRRYLRKAGADGLAVPPRNLVFLVAGTPDISWFLETGAQTARCITETLARRGVAVDSLDSILDFGCGCGRVIRHWGRLPKTRIRGTDYNPALIEWCRDNIPFGDFTVNRLSPPLKDESAGFDLIYAISVFTHLPEPTQIAWMTELARLLKPGGHLILTTHGEKYLYRLSRHERELFQSGGLVVKNAGASGSNTCSAYHPMSYIRDRLARGFELVDFQPGGALGVPHQDLVLLRAKPTSPR